MKKQAMTVFTGGGAPENSTLRGFCLTDILQLLQSQSKKQREQSVNNAYSSFRHCEPVGRDNPLNKSPYHTEFISGPSRAHLKNKKCAFTLAEVLITLGIIGIVAAMTLPTLIQRQQEKETVVKLKKFYSVMDQAIKMSIIKNGDITGWGLTTWDNGGVVDPSEEQKIEGYRSLNAFLDNVLPQLRVLKVCRFGEACKDNGRPRYSLDGTAFGSFASTVILADGTDIVTLTVHSPDCSLVWGEGELRNMCGELFVDINGKKPPNTTGKDVFLFFITKNGIVPMGTSEQTTGFTFTERCNMANPNALNGYGCTAWVIYNENMDYLHCNDLTWNGKTKCK